MANSTYNNVFKTEILNILETLNTECSFCEEYFHNFKIFKKKWNKVLPRETNFSTVGVDDYVAFEENISKQFVSIHESLTETINTLVWFDKELNLVTQNEIKAGTNECIVLLNEVKSLFEKVTFRLDEYANFYANGEPHYEDVNQRPDSNDKIIEITVNQKNILNQLERVSYLTSYIKDLCNTAIEDSKKQEQIFNQDYIARFNEEKSLLIKQFENDLNNLKEKYDNSFKSHKLELEGLNKSTDLLRKSLDNGMTTQTQLFGRIQKFELEFSQIIKDKTDIIEIELETAKTALSGEINSIKQTLYSDEKSIREAHNDFLTLVGNAGIYKLTENYNEKAKDEKKEYKRFRRYTAYSLIAAILSTFFIFIWALFDKPDPTYVVGLLWQPESSNKIDYFLLLSRLSISLMFFVLAFYLSKQASKHYECFQENHRTFLQLAALEPFMLKIDEDEQKTIRKGLIPTYFNQNTDGKFAPPGEEVGLPSSLSAPIEKLTDVLKSLVDKSSDSSKPN
ncbi:hypothetical protein Q5X58_15675 [Acinetobacter baumannii]|nr:hypothetical protein [Acinetobacter baumannii]